MNILQTYEGEIVQSRNIVLADCSEQEIGGLCDSLSSCGKSYTVRSHIANWKREGVFSEFRRYAKYFLVALFYFFKRKHCDVIVGWQQFYALIFCFYCSLFSVKKSGKIVALNFTYKEKHGRFRAVYRWFMGKCVSTEYLDFIHVLSENYADYVSREFLYPRARIIVCAFGVRDRYDELSKLDAPAGLSKEAYALAIGRSNRDYEFLINSWKHIDFPLVIISDTFKKECSGKNITIINDIAGEESLAWIANCGLMILPIADGKICSGDTVLLTAMSLERKVIATVPSTLAETYIVDGENAVLAEKDEAVFTEAVRRVLFSKEYSELGKKARESYLKSFTTRSMGLALRHRLSE